MSEKYVIYIFKDLWPMFKNNFNTKSTIWNCFLWHILEFLKIYTLT
jgi:hypothetical protein